MDLRTQSCTAVHVHPSYRWIVHVSDIGSNHTTSNGTICFSLFSIALHTTNVNRHSSILHDMQPNESCRKCPIHPLYRLTNLSTDSPNTLASFTWLQAHNHSLTLTFSHLTSGSSTPATSVSRFVLPRGALCVPGGALSACVPLATCAISWPPKRQSMFLHIYI
jgi:hypothetical protein